MLRKAGCESTTGLRLKEDNSEEMKPCLTRSARSAGERPCAGGLAREGPAHAPRTRALRILTVPVLLCTMVAGVFPFEHGVAFVHTHRIFAAGPQRRSSACPITPAAAAPVALRGGGQPNAEWPPAWARPHLKLASAASSFRGAQAAGQHAQGRTALASSFGQGSGQPHARPTERQARAPLASALHPRKALNRGQTVRKRTGVALRGLPASGGGGLGSGGQARAGGKRFMKSGFVRAGLKKKAWGARSSFPSSTSSATAPWMATRKASDGTVASASATKTKKTAGGGYKLVIVESPAKARTIQKFLDSMFVVESCMGHVRDLPRKARDVPIELKPTFGKMLGVDADNGFTALYVTMDGKEAIIKKLKDKLKGASELILASDEDREGEAISWHLLELLKPKVPVKRAVFHEITREAIFRAFESPRQLDYNLVHAQEARRILDRLAGYTMSPLLWRKISPGLSAGRVQSVGLAMIVRRERERLAFIAAEYYDLRANLTCAASAISASSSTASSSLGKFTATLVETAGKFVASGRDFDANGLLKGAISSNTASSLGDDATNAGAVQTTGDGVSSSRRAANLVWLRCEEAEELRVKLEARDTNWSVRRVESKQQRRKPPVPFITSTIQQEANRKLSMSSKECMRVAQSLYEAGWITYMRTDNPVLSEAGKAQARQCVSELYGAQNLGPERVVKKPKGSQEAHEPIRPAITDEGNGGGGFNMNPPLEGQQSRLYEMILQRTLASVMVDAVLDLTTVDVCAYIKGTSPASAADGVFRASGTVVKDPGWMRAYEEGNDSSGAAGGAAAGYGGGKLPALQQGQKLGCKDVSSLMHNTRAPPRYTEASFVKELEAEGIGRPSTYAQILETLKDRGYVHVEGKAICPSLTAVVVVQLLERHFKEFVDTAFTARMEGQLDRIATGEAAKETYLAEYYLGPEGLRDKVKMSEEMILPEEARRALLPISFVDKSSRFGNVSVYVGPYGAYAQATTATANADGTYDGTSTTLKANLPDAVCRDVVLLTPDTVHACLEAKQGPYNGTLLGREEDTGLPVLMRVGRYGAYLQVGEGRAPSPSPDADDAGEKPRTVSLPKDVALAQVDMDMARNFLALPRIVGIHPETGKDVLAGVGPYGAFVRHSTTYRSLAASDDVLTIGHDRALELLASASKSSAASQTIALIGELDGKNITVMKGKYGPYIKFGTVNARLPDLYRDIPEEVPLAEAMEAILAKAAQDPKAKGRSAASRTPSKSSKTTSKSAKSVTAAKLKGAASKAKGSKVTLKKLTKPKSAIEAKTVPKRARTAFLFFCSEKRPEVAARGLDFGDITKELAVMWKALSTDDRNPYDEMFVLEKLKLQSTASTTKSSTTTPRTTPAKISKITKITKLSVKSESSPSKRPRSAYLFFCVERREAVASEGLSFGDITKRLSTLWKDLAMPERAKFDELAKMDQERYRREIAQLSA